MASEENSEIQVLRAVELFGKRLYQNLWGIENNNNVLFSPLMIHHLLSNFLHLAENSSAKDSFIEVVGLPNSKIALDIHGEIQNFLNQLPLLHLDVPTYHRVKEFENMQTLRGEVYHDDKCTNGKINGEKLAKINADKLILLHRTHFKSSWAPPLKVKSTEKENFKVFETEEVQVEMVTALHTYKYKNDDHLDSKIIEIPLAGEKASILILLPNNPNGIYELEKEVADFDLEELTDHLRPTFIDITLPKISTEVDMFLNGAFEKMGLEEADKPEDNDSTSDMEIGEFIHKSLFEVDELKSPDTEDSVIKTEDPEMEKQQSNELDLKSEDALERPRPRPCHCRVIRDSVRVNHPFMMYVIFKTETGQPCILFQGKIMNPLL